MNLIAEKLAKYIAININDINIKEKLRFGIEVFLGTVWQIFLILLLAFLLGIFLEVLFALGIAGTYRIYAGGAHAEKYYTCTLIAMIAFLTLGYLATIIPPHYYGKSFILILIIALITAYIYVPVDNPKRIINDTLLIKKLRKKASIILALFLILSIVFYFYFNKPTIAFASLLGILWQSFMLTRTGHLFIGFFDLFFNKLEMQFIGKGD